MIKAKPFSIPKELIVEAYKRVKPHLSKEMLTEYARMIRDFEV